MFVYFTQILHFVMPFVRVFIPCTKGLSSTDSLYMRNIKTRVCENILIRKPARLSKKTLQCHCPSGF